MKKRKLEKRIPRSQGIVIKKQFGQHFLRQDWVTNEMLAAVTLENSTSVFEIGCGDGFLTRAILTAPIARLWVFEIDPQWANYVRETIQDDRLTVFEQNFLDLDFTALQPHAPWTILANLPYQVTFPILHLFQQHRALITQGVVMVQEEVAQKITKTSGRGYGYISLYFQHYFNWRMLSKIPPSAFLPPPKVNSRLLHFTPRTNAPTIPDKQNFWPFIKVCFKQPRSTLRNNLHQSHYNCAQLPESTLSARAQPLSMTALLELWELVR